MRAGAGPFVPGLRRGDEAENKRRYFRSTNSLWNLNSVARLNERAALADPAWAQEQGGQPEDQAIEGGEIGRSTSGAIADQQLMSEKQGFRGEGTYPAGAQELGNGDKQMNGEDQ